MAFNLRLLFLSKVKIIASEATVEKLKELNHLKSSAYSAFRFVDRLGMHHFAHLRATAEGLDVALSARRYLGVETGPDASAAHLQTIDAIRTIARRRGEKDWRLIGAVVRNDSTQGQPSL